MKLLLLLLFPLATCSWWETLKNGAVAVFNYAKDVVVNGLGGVVEDILGMAKKWIMDALKPVLKVLIRFLYGLEMFLTAITVTVLETMPFTCYIHIWGVAMISTILGISLWRGITTSLFDLMDNFEEICTSSLSASCFFTVSLVFVPKIKSVLIGVMCTAFLT